MKTSRLIGINLLSITLIGLAGGLAWAEGPTSSRATPAPAAGTALSLAQVHARLLAAGYRNVIELEHKRHRFEAKAQNPDGRWVEVELDLGSAAVRPEQTRTLDDAPAAVAGPHFGQLLAQLEAAGYRAFAKIEREHDKIEVRAEDAQGRRVKLALDLQSGALRSQ